MEVKCVALYVDTNCAEEPVPTGAANQQTKQLLEPRVQRVGRPRTDKL